MPILYDAHVPIMTKIKCVNKCRVLYFKVRSFILSPTVSYFYYMCEIERQNIQFCDL